MFGSFVLNSFLVPPHLTTVTNIYVSFCVSDQTCASHCACVPFRPTLFRLCLVPIESTMTHHFSSVPWQGNGETFARDQNIHLQATDVAVVRVHRGFHFSNKWEQGWIPNVKVAVWNVKNYVYVLLKFIYFQPCWLHVPSDFICVWPPLMTKTKIKAMQTMDAMSTRDM